MPPAFEPGQGDVGDGRRLARGAGSDVGLRARGVSSVRAPFRASGRGVARFAPSVARLRQEVGPGLQDEADRVAVGVEEAHASPSTLRRRSSAGAAPRAAGASCLLVLAFGLGQPPLELGDLLSQLRDVRGARVRGALRPGG